MDAPCHHGWHPQPFFISCEQNVAKKRVAFPTTQAATVLSLFSAILFLSTFEKAYSGDACVLLIFRYAAGSAIISTCKLPPPSRMSSFVARIQQQVYIVKFQKPASMLLWSFADFSKRSTPIFASNALSTNHSSDKAAVLTCCRVATWPLPHFTNTEPLMPRFIFTTGRRRVYNLNVRLQRRRVFHWDQRRTEDITLLHSIRGCGNLLRPRDSLQAWLCGAATTLWDRVLWHGNLPSTAQLIECQA